LYNEEVHRRQDEGDWKRIFSESTEVVRKIQGED